MINQGCDATASRRIKLSIEIDFKEGIVNICKIRARFLIMMGLAVAYNLETRMATTDIFYA